MEDQDFLDQAAIAALPVVVAGDHSAKYDTVAEKCYRLADALLAEKKDRVPLVLESLTPASATLGSPSFTLHVIGTGFKADSVIYWNGGAEPTTFVSDTELTTEVNMETATTAIDIPVMVMGANGVASKPLTFSLTEAATRKGKR